jgi:hypothetical protein
MIFIFGVFFEIRKENERRGKAGRGDKKRGPGDGMRQRHPMCVIKMQISF